MCCGGGSAPAAPDYTPIATANLDVAKIQDARAQEQLDWAKAQYADTAPMSKQYLQSMMDSSAEQGANARADRARYEQTYQPLEDSYVQQARDWNSPARQEQNAAEARADVAQTFSAARKTALSNLESYGIDPSQTRYGALDLGTRISEAAASAAAGTAARRSTEATGLALMSEGINIGKGYPGNVAQSYAGATGAGQAGINAGLNTSATYGNMMGSPTAWSGLATGNRAGAVGALNTGFNNQMAAYNANQQANSGMAGGLGGLVGGIGGGIAGWYAGGGNPMAAMAGANMGSKALGGVR